MGCFESFTADVKCQYCGAEFEDDNIQSKDFSCVLDHLKKGEDTRKFVERGFLYKDMIFDKKLTVEKAINIQKKYPKKYSIMLWRSYDGKPMASLYHFYGFGQTTFADVKDRNFHCYTSCKKCKKVLYLTGVIKNYEFLGVSPLLLTHEKTYKVPAGKTGKVTRNILPSTTGKIKEKVK